MSNILVIGTYRSEHVDSFDWWQKLPNLSDYDIVILDTSRITHFWLIAGRLGNWKGGGRVVSDVNEQDKAIRSNLALINRKILEILEFDVTIYVLYEPPISVNYGLGKIFYTDDWCPISIKPYPEKGKTIIVKDNSYEEYFRDFEGWEYYFVSDSIDMGKLKTYYESKYKVVELLEPIATNKVEKPLAIELGFHFFNWEDEKRDSINYTSRKTGGTLTLLPITGTYETLALIEILLQRTKEVKETPRPTWVNKIEIPGEASVKAEIVKENKKLEEQTRKVKELGDSLAEIEKYKRLLYATGLELQEICKLTLEKIGAKTKPSPVTDEFMIEVNGKEALVEVKGNTKSITKDDLAQLIADLAQQIKAANSPGIIKGILIGNAWRGLSLDERDNKDVFTRHVVDYAEAQNIGLLSTVELFNAYCKIIGRPECRPEILDKIINSKGIIRL